MRGCMEYNDDQILSLQDYEKIAKAYAKGVRNFKIISLDNEETSKMILPIFELLYSIKASLFALGGFLGTSKFYSLNERQIKKLSIMLDFDEVLKTSPPPKDKTRCLLKFLADELVLIRNLSNFAEKSNFERQIKEIIDARLALLSQILGGAS